MHEKALILEPDEEYCVRHRRDEQDLFVHRARTLDEVHQDGRYVFGARGHEHSVPGTRAKICRSSRGSSITDPNRRA